MFEPPSGTQAVLGRHRTPASDLDELAAGHLAPAAARRLWAVERGRRMLMLRAVVDAARPACVQAPLTPDPALELLLRAERRRPDVVAGLLEHPGTGVWAVRTLERLRAAGPPDDRADAGLPLWAEVGYLHCLAASAALRSGTEGTIRLPVHGGTVALPALGRIRLSVPADAPAPPYATLSVPRPGGGTARLGLGDRWLALPADLRRPGGGWEPLHRVAWSPAPQAPLLALDDGDPYRDFRGGPLPPPLPPLTREEARRWRLLLREAGQVLHTRHPHAARLLAHSLRMLVPLPSVPRFRTASASYTEAVGSALVSLPQDAVELAVTLVHEARHSVLNGLLHQLALCREDGGPLLYAPWRGDPRPLAGVLHGVYAFAGVADFWRAERRAATGAAAALAHFEFAVWRTAVRETVDTLLSSAGLTEVGRRFVTRLAEETAPWHTEAVPAGPEALARAETADLRAVWRARHLAPDPAALALLADAWRRGAPAATVPVVPSRLRPDPHAAAPDPRSELRRVFAVEPTALERRARDGGDTADRPSALATADVSLLHGAYDRAVRAYLTVLAEHPGSASAWAGLGLALAGAGAPTAARALLHRPELARALHTLLHSAHDHRPDPIRLADWLGASPALSEAN
ncbi:HEXXH motif domain-containing protein [Streptomyces griseosporeus]|uniref:HEXXH motif domain-containing protein n=1 Tax=Streptomyces griseosporeus TaxID=1910 RepID=UPI0036F9F389